MCVRCLGGSQISNSFRRLVRDTGMINYKSIIESAISARQASDRSGPRVLFCPSFSVNEQFLYHDLAVIASLVGHGAQVTYASGYTMCASAYPIYGGAWHDDAAHPSHDLGNLIGYERNWARSVAPLCESLVTMESIIDHNAVMQLRSMLANSSLDELCTLEFKGINVGHAAMNVVRNMNLVSDVKLVPNHEAEMRLAVADCLTYMNYFNRIIDTLKPERIFSHDSFYYPWHLAQKIAQQKGIPFYSYYQGLRPGCFIYVRDEAAMSLNMNPLWKANKTRPLTPQQNEQISAVIEERRRGYVNFHDMPRLDDNAARDRIREFATSKPTAYFPTNVVWDLAALDKDVVFNGFADTVNSLIKYFNEHPEFNLILKAHPDEEREGIPTTVERLRSVVEAWGELPPNVLFIDSKSPLNSYELYRLCRAVISHTTSAGMEAPLEEVPVILVGAPHYSGKGFTDEPKSPQEFFAILENRLTRDDPKSGEKAEYALRYFYHYLFSLSRDVGFTAWPMASDFSKTSISEFLANPNFASMIASVMEGTIPFDPATPSNIEPSALTSPPGASLEHNQT